MKQEKFIQNIAKGLNQREAYKDAYNASGMSDNAIDREASLLMKNPKLTQRLRELADKMAKPTIMTAQERLELSHPYMTTGKTTALTRRTFVGEVMSLLFNMLSRLVITFFPRSKHLLISWLQPPSAVILEPKR